MTERPVVEARSGIRIRPELEALPGYRAGRNAEVVHRELDARMPLIQLAQNEDSRGPFSGALEALKGATTLAHRYPESGAGALRMELAERHDLAIERVFVAAGSTAVVHYLSIALLEPGDEVVFCAPTFPAYRLEALKVGAKPVAVPVAVGGAFDLDAMLAVVTSRTRIAYVTTPNNPTGGIVKAGALRDFLDSLPGHVLPVVDQAYFEYVRDPEYLDGIRLAAEGRPIVVLRTFSKIYGLAGLRAGYGICPPEVAAACAKVHVPFEVSRLASAAAIASLEDAGGELAIRQQAVGVERERAVAELQVLGLPTLSSAANFLQIHVNDGDAVAKELEQRGVIVRPLRSWGVPEAIRVTIGTASEMQAFFDAFKLLRTTVARVEPHDVLDTHG